MSENRIRIMEDRWFVSQIAADYRAPCEEGAEDAAITLALCQRNWAWKGTRGLKKMRDLISSIINGFPVPTCIMNRIRGRFEIYDGRHRIETIRRFATDGFTWEGKKFSELSDLDKSLFSDSQLPVTIMTGATTAQLAEVFIRLNMGVSLSDSDLFWANRDMPLVSATERLVYTHTRLAESLGGIDMKVRTTLANWVALVAGLSTGIAGNISTSYIRASENLLMEREVDDAVVMAGLNALATLYETANARFPVGPKEKATFKKVGKVSAFFLGEWIPSNNKDNVIEKWVGIIGRLRGVNAGAMAGALSTTGAQNLTAEKIAKVLEQVNNYLEHNIVANAESVDSDDE